MNSGDDEFERRLKSDLRRIESDERLARLQSAIAELPAEQQEAFMLLNIEELDVKDAAMAMGCSEVDVTDSLLACSACLARKAGRRMSSGNDDFEQRVKADLRRIVADTSPEVARADCGDGCRSGA